MSEVAISSPPLLELKNLHVHLKTPQGLIHAVRGVSFSLQRGETLGIVGESGCGKSIMAHSILQLIPSSGKITEGEIRFQQENLLTLSLKEICKRRGKEIAMIFQDPIAALNPTLRIGLQIEESLIKHHKMSRRARKERVIELLEQAGIQEAAQRAHCYPHQLSGGMRQRVMIAIALAGDPELLIADEPTTALDVTIQAQILNQLKIIQKARNMSIILITHDLGIVAGMCDHVCVMYAGEVIENATVEALFKSPQHPYTQGLLGSLPHIHTDKEKELRPIEGSPPHLLKQIVGCPFVTRCDKARNICALTAPSLYPHAPQHHVACWLNIHSEALKHASAP